MDVPELIRQARLEAGLSQAALARRAGTSQPAVSAYESGRKSPSTATLERLLAAAGRGIEMTLTTRHPADLSGPVGSLLRAHGKQLHETLRHHGARDPRVFGSVARGEDTDDSDVDLLVEMPAGTSLTDLAALMLDLRELLGRDVDVLTDGALDDAMAATVRREAVPL